MQARSHCTNRAAQSFCGLSIAEFLKLAKDNHLSVFFRQTQHRLSHTFDRLRSRQIVQRTWVVRLTVKILILFIVCERNRRVITSETAENIITRYAKQK